MRKVTFSGAISLDGLLAPPDHSPDWIRGSDEAMSVLGQLWADTDTVLLGRKTYEVAAKAGQGGAYPGIHTYVFSRSMKRLNAEGVSLVSDDAASFVRDLKARPGKGIFLMGGGELANSLLQADLIDEIGFSIQPLLLGAGYPAFHTMVRRTDLELLDCRQFKDGCVYLKYAVKRPA